MEQARTETGRRLDAELEWADDGRPHHFDVDGTPCTFGRWCELTEERGDERRVGYTTYGDIEVSTGWFGIPLGFSMFGGPPLIFETMVFGGRYDMRQVRYSTRAQAVEGHAIVCHLVRSVAADFPLPAKRAHRRRYAR